MKILFHANTLNYRGTTVAITDYAHYNQEILGNESVIAYCKTYGEEKDMGNEPAVIEALEKKFKVIGYDVGNIEKKIDQEKIDLAYFIAGGERSSLPTNCKTAVHAVFQNNDPHGDRYAYISEWLSVKMSNGVIPFVPHMVNLPPPIKDYRQAFGLEGKIVIGRIGGYFTFDIPFVKEFIKQLVQTNNKFVFLFVGTEPFIDHTNVKFINEIHSPQQKANFISTCDAMIHARQRGESFGLSIAEFLSLNKPVMAWSGGHDLNHLEMLKDSGLLYNDTNDLHNMFYSLDNIKEDWWRRVEEYKPNTVMKKFNEVFIC